MRRTLGVGRSSQYVTQPETNEKESVKCMHMDEDHEHIVTYIETIRRLCVAQCTSCRVYKLSLACLLRTPHHQLPTFAQVEPSVLTSQLRSPIATALSRESTSRKGSQSHLSLQNLQISRFSIAWLTARLWTPAQALGLTLVVSDCNRCFLRFFAVTSCCASKQRSMLLDVCRPVHSSKVINVMGFSGTSADTSIVHMSALFSDSTTFCLCWLA